MARRFHLAQEERVQAIETEHSILLPPSIPPCRKQNWPVERHPPLQRWEQTEWVSRGRCVVLTIQRLAAGDLPWSELEQLVCRPQPGQRMSQLPPQPLMVLGTSSGAGKSLMTAALCRVLRRRGETPLPFKGQNMSNNAWVDQVGGEMAYSQALQAWAAGLEPHHSMNPVLLKPQGDSTSEVIHLGQSVGLARAEHYYRDWFRPGWAAIRAGLSELQAAHPGGRLVLEGAGSPVEVNLQSRDLTNLRLAQFLRARCLLVADIERGGVFAQFVGTLAPAAPGGAAPDPRPADQPLPWPPRAVRRGAPLAGGPHRHPRAGGDALAR